MLANLRDYGTKAKPLLARTVNTLFPARCASCREPVGQHGMLCAECWQSIHFITDPMCYRCGMPFEFPLEAHALCGQCIKTTPAFTEARSVFRYDEHSKTQVLALKYQDKTQLAPVFGQWLARAGAPFMDKAHAIIPVPLYYWRLLHRRYNQAALLAYALGDYSSLAVLPDALIRHKPTPPQRGLTRRQREDNMRGAFMVKDSAKKALKGKSVVLVDDVMTTGATINACARTLRDAGIVDVYVLTLACAVLSQ